VKPLSIVSEGRGGKTINTGGHCFWESIKSVKNMRKQQKLRYSSLRSIKIVNKKVILVPVCRHLFFPKRQ
jgi:hypothetical protein